MPGAPVKLRVVSPHPPDDREPEPPPQQDTPESPRWSGVYGFVRRHLVEPFVRSKHPPWFDARGTAVGFVVGFFLPFGSQLIGMVLMRTIFRYNVVIAFTVSWVSNPFTIIPLYYAYYYVGSKILGGPKVMSVEAFRQLVNPILQQTYFWETFQVFMTMSYDIIARCFVTASIVTVITAVIGYVVTLKIQTARCVRKAEKAGISYKALVDDLERRLKEERNGVDDEDER